MMAAPIVTSALLLDLEAIAHREDLTPRDPWESPPTYIPDGTATIVVLVLDGSTEKRDPEACTWSDVAAFRFESALGVTIDPDADDWDYC